MHMLTLLLVTIIALTQCVSALTRVPFNNCGNQGSLNVSSVDVVFNENKNILAFVIQGTSSKQILGIGPTFLATAFTTVKAVSDKLVDDSEDYCRQVVCPYNPGPIRIEKSVNLSRSVPLSTLTVNYKAFDENATQITCLEFEYTPQYGYYSQVFTWLPASMTLLTWLVSSIASVFSPGQLTTDIFQITSSQEQLLRLKTPGFFDIMFYTQFAVSTAELSLNYPGYYQPFMSHFGWGSLMFNHSEIVSLQNGNISNDINAIKTKAMEFIIALLGGLGNYVLLTGLHPANLFPETLVIFLIIFAIVAVLCGLIWGSWETLKTIFSEKFRGSRAKGFSLLRGSLLRVFFLFYFPLLTAAFYQLTIRKLNPVWVTILAVIVVIIPCLAVPIVISIYLFRASEQLYSDIHMLLRYGTLYNTFKRDCTSFLIVVWIYLFLRAVVTGAGQGSGAAQAALLLFVEALYLIAIVAKQPYKEGVLNYMYIVLGLFRTLISGLLLLLIPNFTVASDTRKIVGYAVITFHGLAYCTFTVLALKHLLEILFRWCGLLDKEIPRTEDRGSNGRLSTPSNNQIGGNDDVRRGSNATTPRYQPHTYEHVDGSVSGLSDENESTFHGSQTTRLSYADLPDESYYRASKFESKKKLKNGNGRDPIPSAVTLDDRNNSMHSSHSFPSITSDTVASMSSPRRTPLQMTNIQPWNQNMQIAPSGITTSVPPVHERVGSVDSVVMMHPGPVSSTAEESTTYQPPRQPLAGEFGRQNIISENITDPPPGVPQPGQSSSFFSRFTKKIFGSKKKQDDVPYRNDNGSLIDSQIVRDDRKLFVVNPDSPHRTSIVHVGFPASDDFNTETEKRDENDNGPGSILTGSRTNLGYQSRNNFASESRDNMNTGLFNNTSTGMSSNGLSDGLLGGWTADRADISSTGYPANRMRDDSVGQLYDTPTNRSPYSISPTNRSPYSVSPANRSPYSVSPTFSPNLPPSVLPTMSPNLSPVATHSPALLPTLSYTARSPVPRNFTPTSQRPLSPPPLSQSTNTYNAFSQYGYATGSDSQRYEIDPTRSTGGSTSSHYDEEEEEIFPIESEFNRNNFI